MVTTRTRRCLAGGTRRDFKISFAYKRSSLTWPFDRELFPTAVYTTLPTLDLNVSACCESNADLPNDPQASVSRLKYGKCRG